MTEYFIDGVSTIRLDRAIEKALAKLDANDNHLLLKNGDDIEVYADGDDWTVIDSVDHGGVVTNYSHRYDAILAIMKMATRQ